MKRIVLDCDPGIDDALAIILAIKSKEFQIDGITTVAGNASINDTAKNVLKVLELLEIEEIPVYKGEKDPLEGVFLSGEGVHGRDGLGENNLNEPSRSCEELSAVDFLIEYVQRHRNNNTLIATGPLTNVAKCILKNPPFAEHVNKLIIMGGAIKTPGNITRTAEFNIFSDPKAAKIVFESGISNITLVPLDVTRQVLITPEHLRKLDKGGDEKGVTLPGFVYWILDYYLQFCIRNTGLKGCPLHDPLAVGEAIDPSFTEKRALDVRVVTKSETFGMDKGNPYNPAKELIRGQTVAELRKGESLRAINPNVKVCLEVDKERFLQYFLRTINS